MPPESDRGTSRSPQPVPGSAQAVPASPTAAITFEQIRERAYDLWERHHRPEDFSIALWLMAERELRSEREGRNPSATPKAALRSDVHDPSDVSVPSDVREKASR